jgi:hypothetical protein
VGGAEHPEVATAKPAAAIAATEATSLSPHALHLEPPHAQTRREASVISRRTTNASVIETETAAPFHRLRNQQNIARKSSPALCGGWADSRARLLFTYGISRQFPAPGRRRSRRRMQQPPHRASTQKNRSGDRQECRTASIGPAGLDQAAPGDCLLRLTFAIAWGGLLLVISAGSSIPATVH